MAIKKKVFDIGFDFRQSEIDTQARKAQELMHLVQLGFLDRDEARRQLIGENPWLTEAKKIGIESPKKPVEKVEPAPGKRKIVL